MAVPLSLMIDRGWAKTLKGGTASVRNHKASKQSTVKSSVIYQEDQFYNLKEALSDGFQSFCAAAGIAALHAIMEEDVAKVAGPKGKHNPDRRAYRHGFETTSVTIAGANTPILRPRVWAGPSSWIRPVSSNWWFQGFKKSAPGCVWWQCAYSTLPGSQEA